MSSFGQTFCLFEDRLNPRGRTMFLQEPTAIITAHTLPQVDDALARIDETLAQGKFVAGYLAYEAGYAMEPAAHAPSTAAESHPLPLIKLGVFDTAKELSPREADDLFHQSIKMGHRLGRWQAAVDEDAYTQRIDEILGLIRDGDIYQANYTFDLETRLEGDPLSLYAALRVAQPVSYGAFLRLGDADILSLSPELFARREGKSLSTKPMKGTIPRGVDRAQDPTNAAALRQSNKDLAENLMIVDLLRNDISRVCVAGSVAVPRLFDVETYPTFHTMTSTVKGQLRDAARTSDILRAIFPCGSVTGAPKIRAQQVIQDQEQRPRGPYTGAIGFFDPSGDFQLNVAIRTLSAFPDGRVIYPVGSGIVADSRPHAEYRECLLKAKVIMDEAEPFELIETIAWREEEGFALLDRHMARLEASAAYFSFAFDRARVLTDLAAATDTSDHAALRVRLRLHTDGQISVSSTPLGRGQFPPSLPIELSECRMDAANPMLRHKTTRRTQYEHALQAAKRRKNVSEVIFANQHGELTEGTWTNLFIRREGSLLTPPVSCGLLPGTLRAELLASGAAQEAILFPEDLHNAEAIFLGNSVRGLMPAHLATEPVSTSVADGVA